MIRDRAKEGPRAGYVSRQSVVRIALLLASLVGVCAVVAAAQELNRQPGWWHDYREQAAQLGRLSGGGMSQGENPAEGCQAAEEAAYVNLTQFLTSRLRSVIGLYVQGTAERDVVSGRALDRLADALAQEFGRLAAPVPAEQYPRPSNSTACFVRVELPSEEVLEPAADRLLAEFSHLGTAQMGRNDLIAALTERLGLAVRSPEPEPSMVNRGNEPDWPEMEDHVSDPALLEALRYFERGRHREAVRHLDGTYWQLTREIAELEAEIESLREEPIPLPDTPNLRTAYRTSARFDILTGGVRFIKDGPIGFATLFRVQWKMLGIGLFHTETVPEIPANAIRSLASVSLQIPLRTRANYLVDAYGEFFFLGDTGTETVSDGNAGGLEHDDIEIYDVGLRYTRNWVSVSAGVRFTATTLEWGDGASPSNQENNDLTIPEGPFVAISVGGHVLRTREYQRQSQRHDPPPADRSDWEGRTAVTVGLVAAGIQERRGVPDSYFRALPPTFEVGLTRPIVRGRVGVDLDLKYIERGFGADYEEKSGYELRLGYLSLSPAARFSLGRVDLLGGLEAGYLLQAQATTPAREDFVNPPVDVRDHLPAFDLGVRVGARVPVYGRIFLGVTGYVSFKEIYMQREEDIDFPWPGRATNVSISTILGVRL